MSEIRTQSHTHCNNVLISTKHNPALKKLPGTWCGIRDGLEAAGFYWTHIIIQNVEFNVKNMLGTSVDEEQICVWAAMETKATAAPNGQGV